MRQRVASGTHRYPTVRFFATDSNKHRATCWQVVFRFQFSDRNEFAVTPAHLALASVTIMSFTSLKD
jgi:hypothetical protein